MLESLPLKGADMFAIHEQVARLIKANIEAMLAVTKTAFATAEQFGGL